MIHTGLQLPIFWCHGAQDNEIPESYGADAVSFMRHTLSIPDQCLIYKRYDGLKHTINDAELEDTLSWLKYILD